MAGMGINPPMQVHHRSAAIVSIHEDPTTVGCGQSLYESFRRDQPNPNELIGAIVGGPDIVDGFQILRNVSSYTEPTTYINAAFVGLIAKFVAHTVEFASPRSFIEYE
ncbi:hypothetical protein M758_5G096500 [Ceratodon purpureus]|nr:hypothetical protein M758_5G096500 [Ceratodon purpureus]